MCWFFKGTIESAVNRLSQTYRLKLCRLIPSFLEKLHFVRKVVIPCSRVWQFKCDTQSHTLVIFSCCTTEFIQNGNISLQNRGVRQNNFFLFRVWVLSEKEQKIFNLNLRDGPAEDFLVVTSTKLFDKLTLLHQLATIIIREKGVIA